MRLAFDVPEEVVEAIAQRVAEIVLTQIGNTPSDPVLDVDEAAAYLRCKPQRIYDLKSLGRLEATKDGRRLLFRRSALDQYLKNEGSPS